MVVLEVLQHHFGWLVGTLKILRTARSCRWMASCRPCKQAACQCHDRLFEKSPSITSICFDDLRHRRLLSCQGQRDASRGNHCNGWRNALATIEHRLRLKGQIAQLMRELIANSANRVQNKMFMLTYEPKGEGQLNLCAERGEWPISLKQLPCPSFDLLTKASCKSSCSTSSRKAPATTAAALSLAPANSRCSVSTWSKAFSGISSTSHAAWRDL